MFIFNNFNSTFRVPKDKSFGTIGIKQGKDKRKLIKLYHIRYKAEAKQEKKMF